MCREEQFNAYLDSSLKEAEKRKEEENSPRKPSFDDVALAAVDQQERAWCKFEAVAKSGYPISSASVPFPQDWSRTIYPACSCNQVCVRSEIKSICSVSHCDDEFKVLARRWHPGGNAIHTKLRLTVVFVDKFRQRFGGLLRKAQHDEIMNRVQETFQIISATKSKYS